MDNDTLFQRIRDAYDSDPGDLLCTVGVSFEELLELLLANGSLTEESLPFVFNNNNNNKEDIGYE